MTTVLIGIDDTDFGDSPGTGKLARGRLQSEISRFGGRPQGITGHQFLIDDRIPYTGHNRGICLGIAWDGPLAELEFVFDLVGQWSAEGSDPGVCIAAGPMVSPEVMEWGMSALHRVLSLQECRKLGERTPLILKKLGGTGQGIIGALASVGLRAGGEHGRFVDMPGLRELGERVSALTLAAMGIQVEHQASVSAGGAEWRREEMRNLMYKTLGWIRPRLSGGKAVLAMEWSDDHDAWVPVDRKKVHPMAQGSR